jgi:hypothetical protein
MGEPNSVRIFVKTPVCIPKETHFLVEVKRTEVNIYAGNDFMFDPPLQRKL